MTVLERVLVSLAVVLLALVVAACAYFVLMAGPYTLDGGPPTTVVLSQLGMLIAPALATIAFACIAGLVFLRAARWRR